MIANHSYFSVTLILNTILNFKSYNLNSLCQLHQPHLRCSWGALLGYVPSYLSILYILSPSFPYFRSGAGVRAPGMKTTKENLNRGSKATDNVILDHYNPIVKGQSLFLPSIGFPLGALFQHPHGTSIEYTLPIQQCFTIMTVLYNLFILALKVIKIFQLTRPQILQCSQWLRTSLASPYPSIRPQ